MSIKTGDALEQAELQRQQEIAEEEYKRKMKLEEQKNESLKKQLEAKDRS